MATKKNPEYTAEQVAELAKLAESAQVALNTRIPAGLKNDLKRVASHKGVTLQDFVTDELRRATKRELKKMNEAPTLF